MENHLHCLRDFPHSMELWLRLGMGGQKDFFSLTESTTWVKQMACGTLSLLFLAGLWQAWCWRNNSIFEEQPYQIHEVARKTRHCMMSSLPFANLRALTHLCPEF